MNDLNASQAIIATLPTDQLKEMGKRMNVLQNLIIEELKKRNQEDV